MVSTTYNIVKFKVNIQNWIQNRSVNVNTSSVFMCSCQLCVFVYNINMENGNLPFPENKNYGESDSKKLTSFSKKVNSAYGVCTLQKVDLWLTHIKPMFSFYAPETNRKTFGQ